MTRDEAIELVCYGDWLNILMPRLGDDDINRLAEAMGIIGNALRPVRREQVEKVWRGEWIVGEPNCLGFPIHCSRCGWGTDHADPRKWMDYGGHIFCGHCGAPMTDEAVQMVLERLEAMHNDL